MSGVSRPCARHRAAAPCEIKLNNGREIALLSHHKVTRCLPSPDQIWHGDKKRQTFVEGISFLAAIRVSSDRRQVRVRLTEKTSELQEIQRLKVPNIVEEQKALNAGDVKALEKLAKEVDAETPFLKETTHTQIVEIADGGSILVPVYYRPRSTQEKNRWWVLSISPRIYIHEEEEQIRKGLLPPIPRQ